MMQPMPYVTTRQQDVLALSIAGLLDKEIARRLGVKRDAVSKAWQRMKRNNNCTSREQLVAYLGRRGILLNLRIPPVPRG